MRRTRIFVASRKLAQIPFVQSKKGYVIVVVYPMATFFSVGELAICSQAVCSQVPRGAMPVFRRALYFEERPLLSR